MMKLSTKPPRPPPATTHPFARPRRRLKYCAGSALHACALLGIKFRFYKGAKWPLTMKHMLTPIPRTAPFVINRPVTFFVAQLESIWEPPSNEQASNAALRVPRRRINRVFMIAPKETNAVAVEPMKESVESAARCSEASLACISPQQ